MATSRKAAILTIGFQRGYLT